jgi:hypothetical protein
MPPLASVSRSRWRTTAFRDGEFEEYHSRIAELDDDAVKDIMTDAVNRTYVLLSKLSNEMGEIIVDRLKEQDDVPGGGGKTPAMPDYSVESAFPQPFLG